MATKLNAGYSKTCFDHTVDNDLDCFVKCNPMTEIEEFQHTISQEWTACNQPSICLLREELEVLKNEVADLIELEPIIPFYGA